MKTKTKTVKDGATAKEIGARRLTSGADGRAHTSTAERANLHSNA